MVTKRKKLMRPQFATFMSAAIENANNNRICGEDDTEKLHYSWLIHIAFQIYSVTQNYNNLEDKWDQCKITLKKENFELKRVNSVEPIKYKWLSHKVVFFIFLIVLEEIKIIVVRVSSANRKTW